MPTTFGPPVNRTTGREDWRTVCRLQNLLTDSFKMLRATGLDLGICAKKVAVLLVFCDLELRRLLIGKSQPSNSWSIQ